MRYSGQDSESVLELDSTFQYLVLDSEFDPNEAIIDFLASYWADLM